VEDRVGNRGRKERKGKDVRSGGEAKGEMGKGGMVGGSG